MPTSFWGLLIIGLSEITSTITGDQYSLIDKSLKLYPTIKKKIACYNIEIDSSYNEHRVNFLTNENVTINNDQFIVNANESCESVTFIFTKEKKFLRKIYGR